jgi:pimeloyl-ACP methyl ester carboxylesterase
MTIGGLIAAALASAVPQFAAHPCGTELAAAGARCGTVAVPENRNRPKARSIDLSVIVIPTTSGRRLPPLFDIEGGPGLADSSSAGFYLTDGRAYHEHRDVVLVDQRGTGQSHPLDCPELGAPETAYQSLYPAEAVARCRRALEAHSDLTQYGTAAAVADLDAVRTALGYETIDLFAVSYGTTFALRYIAAHPARVRSAVLLSVAPPSSMPPRHHAQAAELALTKLFAQCASDSACGAAFKPDDDLRQALAKLGSIKDAPDPEIFLEKLRTLMYQPSTARQIPYLIHHAAEGDLTPFYAATKPGQSGLRYFDGMYLSVTCAESMALFDYRSAAAASRKTRFGDYRLRRQHGACAEWPTRPIGRDYLAPVRANVPVLIVSGGLDPVTPAGWAADVARGLPNSRQILIPDMGHLFDGLSNVECFDSMVLSFYETANARGIDARCVATMHPPPFKISG